MNVAPRPTRSNASLPYITRARARRAEALDVAQVQEQYAAGRCACGLNLKLVCTYHRTNGNRSNACSFDGPCPTRCEHCQREHSSKVKSAFVGL